MAYQKKMGKRACAECGQEFELTNGNARYCPACKKQDYTKVESCPKVVLPKRACHDCGRPTTDYRCTACRRKWALANGLEIAALKCRAHDVRSAGGAA